MPWSKAHASAVAVVLATTRIESFDLPPEAEGAGAAAFAALTRERERMRGKRVAVIVSGQNIDRPWMQTVLAGGTPVVP